MSYMEKIRVAKEIAFKRSLKKDIEIKNKDIPLDPYPQDDGFGNWKSEVEAVLDMMSLKNLFFSESWVYICVNIVARKISGQPISIEKELLRNGTLTRVPMEGNKLIDLFDSPNQYEGYTNFMYKAAAELTLMGNAIIWRLRFHNEMIVLPTEIVTIETDKTGKIHWYIVNFGVAQEFQDIFDGYMKINPNDIIHIRLPHLNSMFWGLSAFIPGRKSVLFDKYTKEFLINFYLKQANPGPVLEMGEMANEKQAMRLLKSIEMNWTGRRNQRRTMILPKGVTAKSLQQTMAEQQLKEHLNINRDDIRSLFAIPPHELGLQQSGSIGSEETKEQIKNFWEQTIIPFQNLIADSFSRFFAKELGPKTFIIFDNSDVAALQEDESKKADLAIKQLSFKTINEIRAELYDMKPVEGGDIIQGTQQQLPNFPFNFSNQSQFGSPKIPLVGEKPQENNENSEENQILEEDTTVSMEEKPLPTDGLLRKYKEWWLGRKTKEDDTVAKNENRVLKNVLEIFEDQAEIAVKEFKKIYNDRLKAEGFFPEEERLKAALSDAFNKFETIYVRSTVPTLQATSEVGYDLHLNVPFNLPSKDEIIALRAENEANRKASLAARAISNFQGFTETTTNDIVKVVERGVKKSKTLQEIAQDIFTYFGEVAPNRSQTIARTETLVAVSLGQKAAEDDASTVIPGMKKMWVTAGDGRVRSFDKGDATDHKLLDGTMVNVGSSWKTPAGNTMEFPRDPRGPAGEIINCRCTWLMVPPEDAEELYSDGITFTGV